MQENKRRAILAVILATTIILGLVGTYAYFTTQGSTLKQNLTVGTGTLALTFEDNTDGFDAELNLGESKSKEFIIRNTGTQPVTTKMYWKNLTNTYMKESLTYKLEYKTSADGGWQDVTTTASTNVPRSLKSSTKELATNLTIPVGGVYYYKLTIKLENLEGINQAQDVRARMTSQFVIGQENVTTSTPVNATLENLNILSNGEKDSFATVATTNEGVYEMADDYGTSYYYRGAVDNNYVKFGGFYWRIIRVNGDGSIRMIYDGTKAYANANGGDGSGGTDRFTHIGQAWNSSYNDAKYVGWMYGGANGEASTSLSEAQTNTTNSDIKTVVDEWYDNNIVKNAANLNKDLSIYLGDEIFCNDRSMSSTAQQWWMSEGTANRGFGITPTAYGGYSRFITVDDNWNTTNPSPKFTCDQKNDAFTVNDTIKGNGDLTRKIGLITADEIVAAGGLGGTPNKNYYLYKNSSYWYWSISPGNLYTNGTAFVFNIHMDGYLHTYFYTSIVGAVAPVINISAEYAKILTGSGTMDSPYQIPNIE